VRAAARAKRGYVAPAAASTAAPPPLRPPPSPLAFHPSHELGALQWTLPSDREHAAPLYTQLLFEQLGSLRSLDFTGLDWGEQEATALAAVLPVCGQLHSLSLASNRLGDSALVALAAPLAALPALSTLSFALNRVGDAGIIALARALAAGSMPPPRRGASVLGGSPLAQLNLSENDIGDPGLDAISTAMQEGHLASLATLQLFKNQIGDAGAISLARVLRDDGHALPRLKTIEMAANLVGRAGAAALAAALSLRVNVPSLQYIGLEGSVKLPPGDEAAVALKRAVAARNDRKPDQRGRRATALALG
jgi:hypothetical protein